MKRYNPKEIEPKWQKRWADGKLYEVTEDSSATKIYATPMLPYPSGTGLHTGHVRNYSITDAVARHHRQRGYNTMSNIGWDSFGLPAENYAIKTGTPPAESTAKNVEYFKEQLMRLGMSYDWSREINTCDPSYYKWTQWVFSLMFKRGLAYKAEKKQWWCEKCNTVLADEQVTAAGKCWRHDGADDPQVSKRNVSQWFFKITEYADEILEATDDLDWPEKIKIMQKNWIGKSKGAEIDFKVVNAKGTIKVFTTRPDTLFGATFIVLAPEHKMVNALTTADKKTEVDAYIEMASKKDEIERQASKDKSGVFTGSYAVNPINGEKIPVWVADYVLAGYGTGAIMAVPAHDERDSDFAKKHDLPISLVLLPHFLLEGKTAPKDDAKTITRSCVDAIITDGEGNYLYIIDPEDQVGHFVGGGVEPGEDNLQAVKREVLEESGYNKVISTKEITRVSALGYRIPKGLNQLVDTTFYEVVVDRAEKQPNESDTQKHKAHWVKKSELKSIIGWAHHAYGLSSYLGEQGIYTGEGVMINSGKYSGMPSAEAREKIVADLAKKGLAKEKTTYKIRDWLISRQRYWGAPVPIIHCPDHGPVLVPEDQLPVKLPEVKNYVPDGKNSSVLGGVEDWVNTVCPSCGKPAKRETDTMDGYVCSTWYLHRYTDAHNDQQAFDPKKTNYWFPLDFYFGADHAVAHLLYIRFFQKVLADAGLVTEREPIKRLVFNGYINAEDGSKMSKSKGNTVDPMDIINAGYGADALRVFELFIAPYDQDTSWNSKGVPGTYRFLNRLWTLVQEYLEEGSTGKEDEEILKVAHGVIKKVSQDLEELGFNTGVAAMMEAVNKLYLIKAKDGYKSETWQFALESLVQLLAPFAPHITEELWSELGHKDSVHKNHWPMWDEKYLVNNEVTLAVQVNGKLRGTIVVAKDASEAEALATAKKEPKIKAYLSSEPKKVIYIAGKILNLVV